MALTFTLDAPLTGPRRINGRKVWTGTITLDANYLTNGWVLTPQNFGFFNDIEALNIQSFHKSYLFDFDGVNNKLRAYQKLFRTGATAAGAQTNGTLLVDQSGAETVVRTSGTATSTSYDVLNHREAAASDANLNNIVIRVRVEGW